MGRVRERLAIHRRQRASRQWFLLILRLRSGVQFSAVESRRWSEDSVPDALRAAAFSVPNREVEMQSTRSWGFRELAQLFLSDSRGTSA